MKLEITILTPGKSIQKHEIKEKALIGRGSQADIELIAEGVSRKHLLIEYDQNKIYLTDQSSNGTFIKDSKMEAGVRTEFNTLYHPVFIGNGVQITFSLKD